MTISRRVLYPVCKRPLSLTPNPSGKVLDDRSWQGVRRELGGVGWDIQAAALGIGPDEDKDDEDDEDDEDEDDEDEDAEVEDDEDDEDDDDDEDEDDDEAA